MNTAAQRATHAVQSIPRNAEGPVFRAPWEAEAFALALHLNERGLFTWKEWAATLGEEIKKAQAAGDPDTGETYYHHWLATLERIVAAKGLADTQLSRAPAMPGSTLASARRMARQSSCAPKTFTNRRGSTIWEEFMSGKTIKIRSSGGGEFDCYLAAPKTDAAVPAMVLASAVHGVDADIRAIADEFAAEGYIVAAPDLFWRTIPGPLAARR